MKLLFLIIETLFAAALAPLVSGVILKLKNNFRMRLGPGILQPYYNLAKYAAKESVVSENASWIFSAAPYIVIASSLTALSMVPRIVPLSPSAMMGDALAVFFVLALGRFFLALAALDTAGAFGGMGSSREMFISSLAEPAAFLAVFAAGFAHGSTSLAVMAQGQYVTLSSLLAAGALFVVTLAETSRIPFDNQETHLELTMVHEAMMLEYSGRALAVLELSVHIRQLVFYSFIALIMPSPALPQNVIAAVALFAAKVGLIAVIVSFIEVSIAKMRLFRAADFLAFAFILAGMAVVASILGV